MKDNITHYIYYSYEVGGRGYIGSRTCHCDPSLDVYFGSYSDKTFRPTKKIILAVCQSKEERYALEYFYQKMHNVVENPHFANRAFQTQKGFSRLGLANSPESRRKMSESRRNRPSGMKGKKHSEETKRRISESLKGVPQPTRGQKWTEERRKAHSERMTGRKGVKHNQETIEKIRSKLSKEVTLKNLLTGEVRRFDSQVQAAKALGVRPGNVSILYTKRHTRLKEWALCDSEGNFLIENVSLKRKTKEVRIVHLETGVISEYESVTEAARAIGACSSTISKILQGRTLRGYARGPEKDKETHNETE